jgi:hypothetical protein
MERPRTPWALKEQVLRSKPWLYLLWWWGGGGWGGEKFNARLSCGEINIYLTRLQVCEISSSHGGGYED